MVCQTGSQVVSFSTEKENNVHAFRDIWLKQNIEASFHNIILQLWNDIKRSLKYSKRGTVKFKLITTRFFNEEQVCLLVQDINLKSNWQIQIVILAFTQSHTSDFTSLKIFHKTKD